jgi:hypothetical protein
MNTVFQVKNNFDHDIFVTSSIGIKATIEPGVAFDINFPSDVHKIITIEITPAEPKETAVPSAVKRASKGVLPDGMAPP